MKSVALLLFAITMNCATALAQQRDRDYFAECALRDDEFVSNVLYQVISEGTYRSRDGDVNVAIRACVSNDHDDCAVTDSQPERIVPGNCLFSQSCNHQLIPARYIVRGRTYAQRAQAEVCQRLNDCRIRSTDSPSRMYIIRGLIDYHCAQ